MAKRFLESASDIDSDSLSTPRLIYEPLLELWGGTIDCDPCTNAHATLPATHKYTWGGLSRPWFAKTYQNHPYSTNLPWIEKAIYEMDHAKRVKELVILCMTSTSTVWWNRAMNAPKRNPIVMCTARIKFQGIDGRPLKHTAQFDTSLLYYGSREEKFRKLFRHVERWTTKGRL